MLSANALYSRVPNKRVVRNKSVGGKFSQIRIKMQDGINEQVETFSKKLINMQGGNSSVGRNIDSLPNKHVGKKSVQYTSI